MPPLAEQRVHPRVVDDGEAVVRARRVVRQEVDARDHPSDVGVQEVPEGLQRRVAALKTQIMTRIFGA
jgi:hypothetical protein